MAMLAKLLRMLAQGLRALLSQMISQERMAFLPQRSEASQSRIDVSVVVNVDDNANAGQAKLPSRRRRAQ